jgi:hypothetical protein
MAPQKSQAITQSAIGRTRVSCFAFLAIILVVTGTSIGPSKAGPLEALRDGDMGALIQQIKGLYEDHEISWADHIDWEIQTYKTVFWYFSASENKIVVGDLPTRDQVADYWRTWSQTLTDGNWDPDSFFVSPTDAYDMALFNQYILTTHESAHAVTDRYDPDHRLRHDYEVNCREFYADRLTAAIVQHTARTQPELERRRARYLDLVQSMHRTIPAQYLVASADYSDLERDCAIIQIDQPTPQTLQPYASAYFTRWQALLEIELPPLKIMFETHLKKRRQQRYDLAPQVAEWSTGHLQTLRKTDNLAGRNQNDGLILDGAKRAAAFAIDGTLWFAETRFNAETSELEYIYGMAEGAPEPKSYTMRWPRPSTHITLRSIAAFGPNSFVATLQENPYRINLVQFERRDGIWMPRILDEWENTARAYVFRTAENSIFVGLTHFRDREAEKTDKSYWAFKQYDLTTGKLLGSHDIHIESKQAVAADDEGRFYVAIHRQIYRIDRLQDVKRIAGTGLEGVRDGAIEQAEFGEVQALQFFPDGSALLLDNMPGDPNGQMIRKLVPPQR